MSEPISVNKNFNQCINICLGKSYDNCADKYIDPSTRAFKQGIATITNPYSLIGGIGLAAIAVKLEDLWKIKY